MGGDVKGGESSEAYRHPAKPTSSGKQRYDRSLALTGMLSGQINVLAQKTDAQSLNQSVRWITTKDQHASHVITTVGEVRRPDRVDTACAPSRRSLCGD